MKSKSAPSDFYTILYNLYIGDETSAKKRFVYPVDLTDMFNDLEHIAYIIRTSKGEAVRQAVKHYAEYLRGLEVVEYRNVTKKQTKQEIQKYLKGKNRVHADEISEALQIDMSLVNEALLDLWKEGWIEPE